MGLFGKKELKRYSAKEIHEEMNLKSILFLQNIIKYNEIVKGSMEAEREIRRLKSMGLKNSTNFKLLEKETEKVKEYNENVQKYNNLKKLLLEVKSEFNGLDCRFLSFEDFESILLKYDLRCGTLDMYTGDIPEKNLNELETVYKTLNKLKENDDEYDSLYVRSKVTERTVFGTYVKRIRIIKKFTYDRIEGNSSDIKDFKNKMSSFPFMYSNENENSTVYRFTGANVKFNRFNISSEHVGTYYPLIAAPRDLMKDDLKFELKPIAQSEDPIIFSITEFGILCYTAWGEEANDVYKQYEHVIEETNSISI